MWQFPGIGASRIGRPCLQAVSTKPRMRKPPETFIYDLVMCRACLARLCGGGRLWQWSRTGAKRASQAVAVSSRTRFITGHVAPVGSGGSAGLAQQPLHACGPATGTGSKLLTGLAVVLDGPLLQVGRVAIVVPHIVPGEEQSFVGE